MPCIVLRKPTGEERRIDQNVAYFKEDDEEISGVDWECGKPFDVPVVVPALKQVFRKCSNCGEMGIYEST